MKNKSTPNFSGMQKINAPEINGKNTVPIPSCISAIFRASKNAADFRRRLRSNSLFHGTCEPIVGELHGGGYDGILWTTDEPAISQNYIPASGITNYFRGRDQREIEREEQTGKYESFVPHPGFPRELLDFFDIGYDVEDVNGQLRSWSFFRKSDHTNIRISKKDVEDMLERFGYKSEDGTWQIKSEYDGGKMRILRAEEKIAGQLYVFLGKKNLRIFDNTIGTEPDLQEPQYHNHVLFRALQERGYDAVMIWDFGQSKKYGNYIHKSLGLFPSGIKKLDYFPIHATNFDFPTQDDVSEGGKYGIGSYDTPEFFDWSESLFKD